jgi:hypothetical protein
MAVPFCGAKASQIFSIDFLQRGKIIGNLGFHDLSIKAF